MAQGHWAHLHHKYGVSDRPHRILALDGGGVRGIITLKVLERLEQQLARHTGQGNAFRLGDWFDLIGGTSTGAIIAAGLARGMTVAELLVFYLGAANEMFQKNFFLTSLLHTRYDEGPLCDQLRTTFGEQTTLDIANDPQWRCLFTAVTTNWTTKSPWPLTNNPFAKYNAPERADCNLRVPLWKIVRASTAAPVFFLPEAINWDPSDPTKTFVFVDGGLTQHNNPSFALYRTATLAPYGLSWPTGENHLFLLSLGTGIHQTVRDPMTASGQDILANAKAIPGVLMDVASADQDLNCRAVGRCVLGDQIDREVGDLIPRRNGRLLALDQDSGRAFRYARINADISSEGLMALGLPDIDPDNIAQLDSVEGIGDLQRVGNTLQPQVDELFARLAPVIDRM